MQTTKVKADDFLRNPLPKLKSKPNEVLRLFNAFGTFATQDKKLRGSGSGERIYKKYGKVAEECVEEKTNFEATEAKCKPAVVIEPVHKMKWKEPAKSMPSKEDVASFESKQKEKENVFGQEFGNNTSTTAKSEQGIQSSKDFVAACKIMDYIKQKQILEQVLNDDENRLIREFFERGLTNPTEQVTLTLNTAMNACYDRIMSDSGKIITSDPDVNVLLQDREKTKTSILETIILCPEFNPAAWGGEKAFQRVGEDGKLADVNPSLGIKNKELTASAEKGERVVILEDTILDEFQEQRAKFSIRKDADPPPIEVTDDGKTGAGKGQQVVEKGRGQAGSRDDNIQDKSCDRNSKDERRITSQNRSYGKETTKDRGSAILDRSQSRKKDQSSNLDKSCDRKSKHDRSVAKSKSKHKPKRKSRVEGKSKDK